MCSLMPYARVLTKLGKGKESDPTNASAHTTVD